MSKPAILNADDIDELFSMGSKSRQAGYRRIVPERFDAAEAKIWLQGWDEADRLGLGPVL